MAGKGDPNLPDSKLYYKKVKWKVCITEVSAVQHATLWVLPTNKLVYYCLIQNVE